MKKEIILKLILFLILIFMLVLFLENIIFVTKGVYKSFLRTLVDEKRYLLIKEGIMVTLVISFFSILFGSILGCLLSYMKKNKVVKKILIYFVKIMQGTPITVLLLISYYVIFASVNINPIYVAILTFSIYFSAYVSEIINGAIESINKNQILSAYALGFNKVQTLRHIIIPQILVYVIPVYKNEVVNIIKLTSICGYISVMELTKTTDIIRNRTYEAFFPLIFAAIIYFLICYFFGKIMDKMYMRINPRHKAKKRGLYA